MKNLILTMSLAVGLAFNVDAQTISNSSHIQQAILKVTER